MYVGGKLVKENGLMELELEKRNQRHQGGGKQHKMCGRKPAFGPLIMIQLYKARAAI